MIKEFAQNEAWLQTYLSSTHESPPSSCSCRHALVACHGGGHGAMRSFSLLMTHFQHKASSRPGARSPAARRRDSGVSSSGQWWSSWLTRNYDPNQTCKGWLMMSHNACKNQTMEHRVISLWWSLLTSIPITFSEEEVLSTVKQRQTWPTCLIIPDRAWLNFLLQLIPPM